MIEKILYILFPLIVGIALGILNYVGLWFTIQKMPIVRHPTLLSMMSFLLRMGIMLIIFYLVMDRSWERLIICLLGFIAVRSFFVRRFRTEIKEISSSTKRGLRHEDQP